MDARARDANLPHPQYDGGARRWGRGFGLRRDSGGDRLVYARAKRRQRERCHLERLAAQRNAHDGEAEQAAHKEPVDGGEDAAE